MAAQIEWLLQSTADHPGLARGLAPRALLSQRETAVYHTLTQEKRRRDWLLGRWTAKQLLCDIADTTMLGSLAILAAADGAPEVWFDDDSNLRPLPLALSISHAHGVALCATAAGKAAIGADLERIATRPASFAAAYFSPTEQALLAAAPAGQQDLLSTAIWSAKEAALKALRAGLRLDTRSVSCDLALGPAEPQTWQAFPVVWQPTGGTAAVRLQGWWRVWQGFVLALAATGVGDRAVAPYPTRRTAYCPTHEMTSALSA